MVLSGEPRKKSPVTGPGIDPGTVRLVAQRLNHYATPGPLLYMKTCVNLMTLSCRILLRMINVLEKVVQKVKTNILCSIMCFLKSCSLWDNVDKYGTARQVAGNNIKKHMRIACWITKTTNTHAEYVIIFVFPL